MKNIFYFIEGLISGTLPFTALMLCGIFLTVKGRFFQFTRFFESLKLVKKALKTKKKKNCITSFQAACTALSSTAGTGNIAGVASALSLGGAGALFWMWISALLGMAIKFTEIALSIIFREKQNGEYVGGPMYYIKNGLPNNFKILGVMFCVVAIPAVFCSGNLVQTNAAIMSLNLSYKNRLFAGLLFAAATAIIINGGIGRIGNFLEKLIPIISILYIIMSLTVILININFVPTAFKMIIEGAFSPKAVTGGAIGSVQTAMLIGASRGIFSNESGLGTSAMAHSVAFDADSNTQGLFGICEVFIDTIVLCTLTGLTILCSKVNINYGTDASSELVNTALSSVFGNFSYIILGIMMCIFAFSSIVGWAVYGDICSGFLFENSGRKIFKFIYPTVCILGAILDSKNVWRLSSLFNGIILCINLPAILFLSNNFSKRKNEYGKKSTNLT